MFFKSFFIPHSVSFLLLWFQIQKPSGGRGGGTLNKSWVKSNGWEIVRLENREFLGALKTFILKSFYTRFPT